MALPKEVKEWFIPISEENKTLGQAFDEMSKISLEQDSIPLIVQLAENPKFDLPGIDIFSGATNLETHDFIHLILGRGVLPKDEAFVLGYTMGSTNRVSSFEEKIYGLFTKYLYPKHYRFSNDDFQVYKDAVRLGYISDCIALDKVNFSEYLDLPLAEVRKQLGVETSLLKAYYEIEKTRYPDCFECQRL